MQSSSRPEANHVQAALAVPWTGFGAARRLLVTRRLPNKRFAGLWEWPGGKVESGESPVQAAVRELMEETGVVAPTEAAELLCTHFDAGPPAIAFTVFVVQLPDAVPPKRIQCSDAQWLSPANAFDRAFPPTNQAINRRIRQWLSE